MSHSHHRYPICQATGKARFGERKDVRLALQASRRCRAETQLHGLDSRRRETRGYRCDACHGWHLTSRPPSRL